MARLEAADDPGFLDDLYADWQARMSAHPDYSMDELRDLFEGWHKPTIEPEGIRYSESSVAGVPVILAQGTTSDGGVVIYCHGGGFCVGSADGRRKLGGHLANHLGALVYVIDYRLAPEHPFPAAIEDSVAVVREVRSERAPETPIFVAGDSAGGNLAIATALKLRDLGEPLPTGVVAFSPWLDMESSGETLESKAATDRLVSRATVEGMAATYLAGASPTDPLANPLMADLSGFPPLYLNAGTSEALLSDTTRFADAAKAAGVDVALSLVEDMQHVFPVLAGRARAADDELAAVARWSRSLTANPTQNEAASTAGSR